MKSSGLRAISINTVERIVWLVVVACALLRVWHGRDAMNPDGVSYLDFAAAMQSGHFDAIVAAYWSPLYPALIASLQSVARHVERFHVAHALNLLIFLSCVVLFRRVLDRFVPAGPPRVFAVALFGWCTVSLVTLEIVTPDLLVVLSLLAAAHELWCRDGERSRWTLVRAGAILAVGYWAKAIVFVFAMALFLFLLLSARSARLRRSHLAGAVVVFALLAAPLVAMVSRRVERVSFSASGTLNYAWFVNGATKWVHWQGDPAHGRPKHPTTRVMSDPPVYMFGGVFPDATYAPWYAPAYWYEGVIPRFDAGQALAALRRGATDLAEALAPGLLSLLLLAVAWQRSTRGKDGVANSFFWAAVVALMVYVFIHVEPRLIAPFLLLAAVSVVIQLGDEVRQAFPAGALLFAAAGLLAAMLSDSVARLSMPDARARDARIVAAELRRFPDASSAGVIGEGFRSYWASAARIHIVAEAPAVEPLDEKSLQRVVESMRRGGATVVVADPGRAPRSCPRIGETEYRLCLQP